MQLGKPRLVPRENRTLLSAASLFGASGVPLRVLDVTSDQPTGIVTAESVTIIFVLSGWARVETGHESSTVEQGTILTIPAGVECRRLPEGKVRTGIFHIHPDYLADQLRWLSAPHPLVNHLRNAISGRTQPVYRLQLPPSKMHDLVPFFVSLKQRSDCTHHEFALLSATSAVFEAVGRYAGIALATEPSAKAMPFVPRREVAAAIGLMCDQLDRQWRIEDLAAEVAMSSSQLRRIFQSQIGISPSGCLRQLRVDRMAELLLNGGISVGEAAVATGWSSPTVAARAFKRRFGLSPREFACNAPRAAI